MSDETSPIRILVGKDHPVVREGIAALVGGQTDVRWPKARTGRPPCPRSMNEPHDRMLLRTMSGPMLVSHKAEFC